VGRDARRGEPPVPPGLVDLAGAAACGIDGMLLAELVPSRGADGIRVAGPDTGLRARASTDGSGRVASASVERTARCLMRGTAWV
jgi:2-methylaconitate cis-trans-isomerase PrpF